MSKSTFIAIAALALIACGDKDNDTSPPGGDSDPTGGDPGHNGGDTDTPPPPSDNPLTIERDVTVGGFVSDRFTWKDAAGNPRVAVLAHNDGQTGPNGSRGGELIELDYQVDGATRTVKADASEAPSGFGYAVSHRNSGGAGITADDSPLGHDFTGTFTRVFEGKNHVVFRFQQNYPRYSEPDVAIANTEYDVPVTIDWVFANGIDDPLWSITWDLSSVPENAVNADSRAPYGQLLFDGSASADAHSVISGVSWNDSFIFETTSAPVTLNSTWDYTVPADIPFVKEWTTDIDATMGTVLTAPITIQDAGGFDYADGTYDNVQMRFLWGKTSATNGDGCPGGIETADGYMMPCTNVWSYQSINFSLVLSDPDGPTNNTRLCWGTNFGFLGQTSYTQHGTQTQGSGYPKQSYSTYIVVGKHSDDAVASSVARVEALSSMTVTTTTGSVVTQGAPGILRSDETTAYAPTGYDRIYGAVAVTAASNAVDMNIAVGSGTLKHPLVIVRNWSGATYPNTVSLNGTALTDGTTYYASYRADTNEMWITIAQDLSGAANRLVISQ